MKYAAIIASGYLIALFLPWRLLLGLTVLAVLAWVVWESAV